MTNLTKPASILTGVAGEYFVAAELSRRGYIASISLRKSLLPVMAALRGWDIGIVFPDVSRRPTGSRFGSISTTQTRRVSRKTNLEPQTWCQSREKVSLRESTPATRIA